MFREKIRFKTLPGSTLRIAYRPSMELLFGAIIFLGAAVWLVWHDGELDAILGSVAAGLVGGALGGVWVNEWRVIELSKMKGASIRRGFFKTWTIPASAIIWVWTYPGKSKKQKFYSIALRLRVELPDDRRRKISSLWVHLFWYNLGKWVEQFPPIIRELNAALTSCGFGQPADVEQALRTDADYEWLAETARRHHDPHVQTVSLETILKQFPRQAEKPLETALDSETPLVALMASRWVIERPAGAGYFKDSRNEQKALVKAAETIQRLVESSSTPAFVQERARWTLRRGERIRRKVRSEMIWFGAAGLFSMAIALVALFKTHTFPIFSASIPYRILGFLCAFFGTQSFFVGFLYALVLGQKQYERYHYERDVRGLAAGFSYVFAFLSLAVFYKGSYLAAFICYLLIYPVLCYVTYKRF